MRDHISALLARYPQFALLVDRLKVEANPPSRISKAARRRRKAYNLACDRQVNQILAAEGIAFPG